MSVKKENAGESASSIEPTEDYQVSCLKNKRTHTHTEGLSHTFLFHAPLAYLGISCLLFRFGTSRFDLDTFLPNTNILNVSVTHAVVRSMATELRVLLLLLLLLLLFMLHTTKHYALKT